MPSLSADDRAQVLYDATAQFWRHIVPIVWVAFFIHIVLFGLFLAIQVPVMWIANGLSIAIYLVCLAQIRRRRYQLAGMLFCGEIIAHAVVATWMLGWDSNFYFYLFCVVPIIAFSFQTAPVRRALLSLSIICVVVGGFALRRQMGHAADIDSAIVDAFGMLNALTATALLLQATALSVRFTLAMHFNLFHSAHRDSLTNLYTRRRVLQRLRQLNGPRQQAPIALVLLDIDHFKQINDLHGHDLGDQVLQRVADALTACVRTTDIAARWGGEEFLILMPDTVLADAQQVAERVLSRIREEAGLVDEVQLKVTATLAVATMQSGEAFRDTLNRADQRLYQGKQEGRDRIMLAG